MGSLRSAWVAVGCLAYSACNEPDETPTAWRFSQPQIVAQRGDGSLLSAWPVRAPGGRDFLLVTATRSDGAGVTVIERAGASWTGGVLWVRPAGATSERVLWTTHDPTPAALTLAEGALGPVLYVRRFLGDAWSAPEPVTLQGSEQPGVASMALGAGGALHVVYGMPGGSCPEGTQLRHRVRGASGWSALRFVADTCGLDGVSVAVAPSAGDPLLVTWTGPSRGAVTEAATDVLASGAARGNGAAVGDAGATVATFRPPFRVLTGDNRGAMVVPLTGGRFLASWSLTTTNPAAPASGQRRAAFNTYDVTRDVWETPNTGWYFTNASPWLVPLAGGAGAMAFGSDGDQPGARVVMRVWSSPERPSSSRNVITTPTGVVSSLRAVLTVEGTAQASWIETQDGGAQRLLWSVALPVAAGDAGRM